jgi:hypothetical protein
MVVFMAEPPSKHIPFRLIGTNQEQYASNATESPPENRRGTSDCPSGMAGVRKFKLFDQWAL